MENGEWGEFRNSVEIGKSRQASQWYANENYVLKKGERVLQIFIHCKLCD